METTPLKMNFFLFFKLPAAFLCGVRVKYIYDSKCLVSVRYRWINMNPFKSMYFAVQAMAAELSTGVLVMNEINKRNEKFSMLVVSNKASFIKKATGKITFICDEGDKVKTVLNQTLIDGEGKTFWMKSIGKNESGDLVSEMEFEWSIKVK